MTLGLVCTPPLKAQAISHGMVQCSALTEVLSTHLIRQPEKGELEEAARVFRAAANQRAAEEGIDPATLVSIRELRQAKWQAMGYSIAFKQEFRDWVGYCRSLAAA